jgi:hypothetical protein
MQGMPASNLLSGAMPTFSNQNDNPMNQPSVPGFPTPPEGVSQQAVALGSGTPTGPLPLPNQNQQASLTTNISAPPTPSVPASDAASLALQSEDDNADDIVWVNRAKRIIAGTKGDPHRQVQLLQQLSVVYLKERYGRSVHADEV